MRKKYICRSCSFGYVCFFETNVNSSKIPYTLPHPDVCPHKDEDGEASIKANWKDIAEDEKELIK